MQFACQHWTIWASLWENQPCGFWPGLTQTSLCSQWRWLEAWNFGLRKYRDCTILVAKTKALISFAVTAKLICVFVFAYAERWFSHNAAHLLQAIHNAYQKCFQQCMEVSKNSLLSHQFYLFSFFELSHKRFCFNPIRRTKGQTS